MRVTSKRTRARSLRVKRILAASRSRSPFGEIVVSRSLSPWNGSRLRIARVEVRHARGGPVDPERRRGKPPRAGDEPDQITALPHARTTEPTVPAQCQEAATLRLDDPAERPPAFVGQLDPDALGFRERSLDPQPSLVRREVAWDDREVGGGSGGRAGERENDEDEAAHRPGILVGSRDGLARFVRRPMDPDSG